MAYLKTSNETMKSAKKDRPITQRDMENDLWNHVTKAYCSKLAK